MPIRVVVVDAHTLLRFGLAGLIEQHGDLKLVAETTSVRDAHRMVEATRPDVVTVDVALPDGDGLTLARELRDRHAGLGIVVLTGQGEDDVLFRALETGASAFVAKTAPADEVLAAIRHAAVAASSFAAVGLASALSRRTAAVPAETELSGREYEVLQLLAGGHSVPVIAGELYVSVSTAKTYVARLYEKLGVANRSQALMAALRKGLVEVDAQATA